MVTDLGFIRSWPPRGGWIKFCAECLTDGDCLTFGLLARRCFWKAALIFSRSRLDHFKVPHEKGKIRHGQIGLDLLKISVRISRLDTWKFFHLNNLYYFQYFSALISLLISQLIIINLPSTHRVTKILIYNYIKFYEITYICKLIILRRVISEKV